MKDGTVLVRRQHSGLKKPDIEHHKVIRADVLFPEEGKEVMVNVPVVE
jgi:hypothetical protein